MSMDGAVLPKECARKLEEEGLGWSECFLAVGFPVNEDQWEEWSLFNTLVDPILKLGWRNDMFHSFQIPKII